MKTINDKLVTEVTKGNMHSYGGLMIAFFDKINLHKDKSGKEITKVDLYIHIENAADKYTVVKRKAGDAKGFNNFGDILYVPETNRYKEAFKKYQDSASAVDYEAKASSLEAEKAAALAESATLAKKVAELEAKAAEKPEKEKGKKSE